MKVGITILSALLVVFCLLFGCSSSSDDNDNSNTITKNEDANSVSEIDAMEVVLKEVRREVSVLSNPDLSLAKYHCLYAGRDQITGLNIDPPKELLERFDTGPKMIAGSKCAANNFVGVLIKETNEDAVAVSVEIIEFMENKQANIYSGYSLRGTSVSCFYKLIFVNGAWEIQDILACEVA